MPGSVLNLRAGKQKASDSPIEQSESLLKTKLFIPSIRLKRVDRPRLIEQVNQGLDKALILVSAPAGYGKTTLLSNWLRETDIPSAWVSLDEGDNDPLHFLQYFITALQRVNPSIGADSLGMLQGMQPVRQDTFIRLLINDITEHATPFILVLDDFHMIHNQLILEMVTFLLEHMPPNMHLALLSRTDPPIPVSRLRARNQLVDIRASQLRFTPDEVAVFLNQVMELNLAASDIATLEARTEGWIAAARQGKAVECPAPGLTWKQIDILNQHIHEAHCDQSLDEVFEYFRTTHDHFMDMVEGIPEEEMMALGRYAFIGKGAVYNWLSGYAAHDVWGKTKIRKWMRAYQRLEKRPLPPKQRTNQSTGIS